MWNHFLLFHLRLPQKEKAQKTQVIFIVELLRANWPVQKNSKLQGKLNLTGVSLIAL